jgi:hypothetical protein
MQSSVRRNKFERMGEFVLICINEDTLEVATTDTDIDTQYYYDSTKVKLLSNRDEVIQTIMRIRYKDIDSEFAARLNGGVDELAHAEWRLIAKSVADEFEVYASNELSNN